jgi:hypothetical protein
VSPRARSTGSSNRSGCQVVHVHRPQVWEELPAGCRGVRRRPEHSGDGRRAQRDRPAPTRRPPPHLLASSRSKALPRVRPSPGRRRRTTSATTRPGISSQPAEGEAPRRGSPDSVEVSQAPGRGHPARPRRSEAVPRRSARNSTPPARSASWAVPGRHWGLQAVEAFKPRKEGGPCRGPCDERFLGSGAASRSTAGGTPPH